MAENVIETILYILWDLKLKVGHSSRSIRDCLRMGREDYTVRTALLEQRFVCGDISLASELNEKLWKSLFEGTAKDFISEHPIVRTVKNKKALYLSPGHTIAIKNLDEKNSKNLLKFLFNHQTKKEFQMSFSWEKNTIVIWDNYSIIHSATPFSGRRLMHRIIIDA